MLKKLKNAKKVIVAPRPVSQPGGPYPSLEAQIPVLRPKSLEAEIKALGLGFGTQDWDLGLEAGIWASG